MRACLAKWGFALFLAAAWRAAGSRIDAPPLPIASGAVAGGIAGLPQTGGSGGASGGDSLRRLLQQPGGGIPGEEGKFAEPGRAVVLYTWFGPIKIRLLERQAPNITAMVWDMAAKRNCSNSYKCAFYRNEARPPSGDGPPYALLQGRMHDLAENPPWEGVIPVKRGHVCFIPGGKDWFISLGDHPEWGKSHPVWGWVDEWRTVDLIIQQQYNPWTNPDSNITLRILKIEVPFVMAAEGDRTYVGPLH